MHQQTQPVVPPPRPPRHASRRPSQPTTPELCTCSSEPTSEDDDAAKRQWERERRLSSLFSALSFSRRSSLNKLHTDAAEGDSESSEFVAHTGEDESESDLFASADEGVWDRSNRSSLTSSLQNANLRGSLLKQAVSNGNLQTLQSVDEQLDAFEAELLQATSQPPFNGLKIILPGDRHSLDSSSSNDNHSSNRLSSDRSSSDALSPAFSHAASSRSSRTSEEFDSFGNCTSLFPSPSSHNKAPFTTVTAASPEIYTSPVELATTDEDVPRIKRVRAKSANVVHQLEVSPKVASPSPRPGRRRSRTAGEMMLPHFKESSSLLIPRLNNHTWRASLDDDIEYKHLETTYGPLEMRRQEIIWELCDTEESFVNSLQGVSRIFFLPLRTPQGHWIKGIPTYVTRLLDWFDDIAHLHSQMARALRSMQWQQPKVVLKVAETLLPFIEHLEVHQPYLARFESVSAEIEELVADSQSDFGEFIRMQQNLPDCGRMTLTSFLLKPVQRLMKYPLFFKQLCEMTPPSHCDHLATLALLHSTDTVLRIMQEVKAREDEYEKLKQLQASLRGLPPNFQIAKRDRKLLAQGVLKRVHISDRDRNLLHYNAMSDAHEIRRSDSFKLGSLPTLQRGLSTASLRETLIQQAEQESKSVKMVHTNSLPGQDRLPSKGSTIKTKAKESSVHVFVLSDIAIFARREEGPKFGRSTQGNSTYQLLEGCGLCRVLGVEDLSGRTEHDNLLEIDLLPINSEVELLAFSLCNASLATSVYLSIPEANPSKQLKIPVSPSPSDAQDKIDWLQAFQRSFFRAWRSLSYPANLSALSKSISRRDISDWSDPDGEDYQPDDNDEKRVSYGSILASGLPLPKSPSQQLTINDTRSRLTRAEPARSSQRIEVVEEREERGYWAWRYRKIKKEIQMDEAAVMEAKIAIATYKSASAASASAFPFFPSPSSSPGSTPRLGSSMSLRAPTLRMQQIKGSSRNGLDISRRL